MNRKSSLTQTFRNSAIRAAMGFACPIAIAAVALMATGPATAVRFQEPDRKPPTGTKGGGTRGPIAPVIPESGYGFTDQARPIFLVHLADDLGPHEDATFFLSDTEGNVRHEVTIPLKGELGIVAFQLPESVPDLKVERTYRWGLALPKVTGGEIDTSTPFGWATIERLPAESALAGDKGLAMTLNAAISASQDGRWYDAAATLEALHRSQPEDPVLKGHWQELLQSVKLDSYIK